MKVEEEDQQKRKEEEDRKISERLEWKNFWGAARQRKEISTSSTPKKTIPSIKKNIEKKKRKNELEKLGTPKNDKTRI